jgi:hypothetical protein
MGEVVSFPTAFEDNQEFVADCCRFAEGILDEKSVRKKYKLADDTWEALASNDVLVAAIELEKVRRVRDGSAKREKAQALVVKAPDVLSDILLDNTANARHRIDSAKTLNDFAANGPGQSAPAGDRFIIQINLGEDVSLKFNKSIRPLEPGEIDPDDSDTTPMIAALATKKNESGGNGDAI